MKSYHKYPGYFSSSTWRCGHSQSSNLRESQRHLYDCKDCAIAAKVAAITTPQRDAITWAERRHPGITATLWRGNVLHGEQLLRSGSSLAMADCGDTLLRLASVNVLKSTVFSPSHSGAAFLGLESGAIKQSRTAPHAGDAAHWC